MADQCDRNFLDVLDRVLDKGIIIDAFARIALAGIDLASVDARCTIRSIDTELKYAEPPPRTWPGQQTGHADATADWPVPDEAVRAVEDYMRQLRRDGQAEA